MMEESNTNFERVEIEVAIFKKPWDYITKMVNIVKEESIYIAKNLGDWSDYPGIDHTYLPLVLTAPIGRGSLIKIPGYETELKVSEEHFVEELTEGGKKLFKHYVKLDLWEGETYLYSYKPYQDSYINPNLIHKGIKIEIVKWT